ncbi:aspartyl-phosphate phosphatase Spo0E family protein [Paenibacillus turicensis]|uniref:aspartyl-phosphate phosphatase Spo0E family protein n=1 Tax=Paenibacillus turicensis TaxID=160487 RepID=UPI003D296DD6
MSDLLSDLEKERSKLNELGKRSFEQNIPLCHNKELQAQSQRVDELLLKLYKRKNASRRT